MGIDAIGEQELVLVDEGDPVLFPARAGGAFELSEALLVGDVEVRPVVRDLGDMDAEATFADLGLGAIAVDHEKAVLQLDEAAVFGAAGDLRVG